MQEIYDLAIVGTGPAGLTAAIFGQRLGLKCVVFGNTPGGNLYMIQKIENYPGFPEGISGTSLGVQLFSQAQKQGAYLTMRLCKVLKKQAGLFSLADQEDVEYLAKAVVLASGLSPKLPDIPIKVKSGVHLCTMCDGPLYRGKEASLAVIGGGNTAGTHVLQLMNIAKEIHLIHRGNELKMEWALESRIKDVKNLTIWLSAEVLEVVGEEHVESVVIRQGEETRKISVDGIFLSVGWEPKLEYAKISINKTPEGYIITDSQLCTSELGVFAAGDIRDTEVRQIITAAADGAKAAYAAFKYLISKHL